MQSNESTRPELIRNALGFDDIGLIASDFSGIQSRREARVTTRLSSNISLSYPIIASPMDTISDVQTCVALNTIGAAGILHRFMSIEDQVEKAKEISKLSARSFVAIGLNDYSERIPKLIENNCVDLLFLDTANGANQKVHYFMKWWNKFKLDTEWWEQRKHINRIFAPDIIVGNTMSKASVSRAFNLGANGVRHGIGIGSMCITSMQTGIHCPAVTSLYYAWKAKRNYLLMRGDTEDLDSSAKGPTILCDGGIRKPADLVKAIAAGADAVICGNIFAGCIETPGEVITKSDAKFKKFRGMASKGVVDDYELSDGTTKNTFVEGEETLVPYVEKSVVDVVYEFANGLRSAMSYLNCEQLKDLKGSLWNGKINAVRLSNQSFVEGTPHGKKEI